MFRYAAAILPCCLLPWLVVSAPPKPTQVDNSPITLDLHCDTLYQLHRYGHSLETGSPPPSSYAPEVTVDLMRKGGLTAQVFAVWAPSVGGGKEIAYAEQAKARFQKLIKDSNAFTQAFRAEDVYTIAASGRLAAILSIEGAEVLGENASALTPWAEAGLLLLGISWNRPNAFADAAQAKEKPYGGLSKEGEALVDLAGELGILIDVSHTSEDSFWDIMRRTTRPVIASHSSANSIYKHPRNLDDEQIRAIRASGGVVGVNFYSVYLEGKKTSLMAKVIEHIKHIAEVGTVSVVAFGSDFDGLITPPSDLKNVGDFGDLRTTLSRAGFSEDDIRRIAAQNTLRAFSKAKSKPPLRAGEIPIPMRASRVKASSQEKQQPASAVADRNLRTAWRPLASDKSPWVELSGEAQAPKSIALRNPSEAKVELHFLVDQTEVKVQKLGIPGDSEGVTLLLPKQTAQRWTVRVVLLSGDGLAEIVIYE